MELSRQEYPALLVCSAAAKPVFWLLCFVIDMITDFNLALSSSRSAQ
jgi:hypothetical protein